MRNADAESGRRGQRSESVRGTNSQPVALTAQALEDHNAHQAPHPGSYSIEYFKGQSSYSYQRHNDDLLVDPIKSTYYTTEQTYANNATTHQYTAESETSYNLPHSSNYHTLEPIPSLSTRRLDGMRGAIDFAGIGSQFNSDEYFPREYFAVDPSLVFQDAVTPKS